MLVYVKQLLEQVTIELRRHEIFLFQHHSTINAIPAHKQIITKRIKLQNNENLN